MAQALIEMGATDKEVNEERLAADVSSILARLTSLEPELRLRRDDTGGVDMQVDFDEVQVTELLLDIVRAAEDNGLKLPREFALLVKQALYFDRYNRVLAPNLDPLRDLRVDLGLVRSGAVIDV